MTQGSNNFVSDQFECGSYHVVRNRISRGNVVGSTRREAILRPLQFIEFVTHYFLLLGANPEFRKTYCSKADALSQRKLTDASGSCYGGSDLRVICRIQRQPRRLIHTHILSGSFQTGPLYTSHTES